MIPILQKYRDNALHEEFLPEIIEIYKSVFDMLFETYVQKDYWSLSGEYSWQKVRQQVIIEK